MTRPDRYRTDLQRFDALRTSRVTSHDDGCCAQARRAVWSELLRHRHLGPRLAAIPEVLTWGPLPWPATWCHLLTDDGLKGDCGVHAHVASLVLDAAGIEHARVSAAIIPAPMHREHWELMWHETRTDSTWIGGELVYHEVLQVENRFWDPSEARWFNGVGSTLECGTIAALRPEHDPWTTSPSTRSAGPRLLTDDQRV